MLQDISVEAGCTISFQMILAMIDGKVVKQIIFIPFIKIDGYVISRFIRNLIGRQRCHCLYQSHIFINNKNCHKNCRYAMPSMKVPAKTALFAVLQYPTLIILMR